ncbi:MAG: undecaprenyl/decaprenyl-phosphate alpha-N-acetylglucosaminyl 1-phosphate transferase [Cyclobacteriaceae bacterium]
MLFLAFVLSFLLAFSIIPVVIRIFKSLDLLDAPDRRKIHKYSTPAFGGIAFLIAILVAIALAVPAGSLYEHKFLFGGLFLMFILGLRDDISSLDANYKLLFQSLGAILAVYYADVRITDLHGLFGLDELPFWFSIGLSIFIVIALTNAFNLIDGIDGLAGSIGLLATSALGFWFYLVGDSTYSILCIATVGALAAFIIFNWSPSKIFMGDTGSIFLGYLLACSSIRFIELSHLTTQTVFTINDPISLSIAFLILPIYDTLRVFIIRIYLGRSPFFPDKNHIHHILLKLGFSHSRSTSILIAFNISAVFASYYIGQFSQSLALLFLMVSSIAFGFVFDSKLKSLVKKQKEMRKSQGPMLSKSA